MDTTATTINWNAALQMRHVGTGSVMPADSTLIRGVRIVYPKEGTGQVYFLRNDVLWSTYDPMTPTGWRVRNAAPEAIAANWHTGETLAGRPWVA